jgi:hypothetical protein
MLFSVKLSKLIPNLSDTAGMMTAYFHARLPRPVLRERRRGAFEM